MDPCVVGLLCVCILLVLIAIGVHIAIALLVSGLFGLSIILGFEQAILMNVRSMYSKISFPELITLPLFILMGYLASAGGISKDIYDSLNLWLGRFKSGLGISTIFACTGFGAVSGSSFVTASVFAKISAPEMRRHHYPKSLSYAICAAAGSIGMLIPPSILAVIYGMFSGLSIAKVLMAGIAPGLLWAFLFSLTVIIVLKVKKIKFSSDYSKKILHVTWRQRFYSLRSWWPIAVVSLSIFGGIYGGVFSPSEAAAVAVFVIFIVVFCMNIGKGSDEKREFINQIKLSLTGTASTSAMIFFIMGSATVFSNLIVLSRIPTKLSELITYWNLSGLTLVIMMVLIYLMLGFILDSISMICITVPMFNPVVAAVGIDPIWYATIVITSIEIGLITPPLGLNLYSTIAVAEPDVSIEDIVAGVIPFLLAEFVALGLLLIFPKLSTFLPGFVGG